MGETPGNVASLGRMLRECTMCPRACGVDRTKRPGACRIGAAAVVASVGPHFGEEAVLVGRGGSGAIFFCGCSLGCVFCQNWDISRSADGREMSPRQIAAAAMRLEAAGCVNVNFVTPTHVSHAVAEAVWLARAGGLRVPVVYNCGGYESVETLRLLEGLIEVYMPDFKWADEAAGRKYSLVADYPRVAASALAEMYRQVGPLVMDGRGVARRGVLVRHLVMPGDLARSRRAVEIVARAAPGCVLNVMGQYHPAHEAGRFPELLVSPDPRELRALREYAAELGFVRADL